MAVFGNRDAYMRMRSGKKPLTEGLGDSEHSVCELISLGNVSGIRSKAKELGFVSGVKFDINAFLKHYSSTIHLMEDLHMDYDMSGYIEFDATNNKWIIATNPNDRKLRKNFTLAHELGHLILHNKHIMQEGRHEDTKLFRSDLHNEIEREANKFAAELLMPQSDIESLIRDSVKTVEALSESFEVSVSAMRYRLNQCGLYWVK